MALSVVSHPLANHLLTVLRDETTPPERFRRVAHMLTTILVLEATQNVPSEPVRVKTPIEETDGSRLAMPIAAVPILRAGLGMLETVVGLFPQVAVGYIGLERNEETALPRTYYSKLPDLTDKFTLCLDPMLATGGSAANALTLLRSAGTKHLVMVSIVSAPEGVAALERTHPDVNVVTASLDARLNERKYIVPGLGDFGDRLYGTQ